MKHLQLCQKRRNQEVFKYFFTELYYHSTTNGCLPFTIFRLTVIKVINTSLRAKR